MLPQPIRSFGPLLLLVGCEPAPEPDSDPPGVPSGLDVPIVYAAREWMESPLPVEAGGRDERPGGTLMRLDPDGTLYPLVVGPSLFDVARPAVSPDGQTIAFAAVQSEEDSWCIWTVPAGGGGATRVTHPTGNPIQDAIDAGGAEFRELEGVGDYAPFWLADGRIGFVSTRYPTIAAGDGQRQANLYVVGPQGGEPARITTTRSGVVDPWPLADGRIVAALHHDNMNVPHPEDEGLRPLEPQRNWQDHHWNLWAFEPDGTGAEPYASVVGGIGDDQDWGVHQAKELPDSRILATVRRDPTLTGQNPYQASVTIFEPGWVEPHEVMGLGLPLESGEGYALCPAPLPSGRILLTWGCQRINADGNEIRPDFGLWVVDGDLDPDSLVKVLNEPAIDEMDAVPIEQWDAEILEVGVDWDPSDDPRVDDGKSAYLTCENVYADLPLGTTEALSPTPGSVWSVWIYDDSQQLDTDDGPRLAKQMPELIQQVDVSANGAFTAEVPADRPLFMMLVGPGGVAARMRYSPATQGEPQQEQDFIQHTHLTMRPGTFGTCRGCHQGHMMDPELTLSEARTNLGRIARVEPLGDAEGQDDFERGPDRLVDQRLPEDDDRFGWVDSQGLEQLGAAVILDTEMELSTLRLYPLQAGGRIDQVRVLLGTTSLTLSAPFDDGEPYAEMNLMGTWADRIQIWLEGEPPLGLGEVVVHGSLTYTMPSVELSAPTELELDDMLRLTWSDDDDPMLGGFELLVTTDGAEAEVRDIGLVSTHSLLLGEVEPGQDVCVQLRPYDLRGNSSGDATSEAACATVPTLSISGIEPAQATVGEPTPVTVQGEGLRDTEDFILSICGYQLLDVQHQGRRQITATTRSDRPTDPSTCDVEVSYANGLHAVLEGAFEFVQGED